MTKSIYPAYARELKPDSQLVAMAKHPDPPRKMVRSIWERVKPGKRKVSKRGRCHRLTEKTA